MPREYKLYLEDIIRSVTRIENYTTGMELDGFLKNELVQDGVIKNLENIGEAVKNIPEDVKKTFKNVEWRKMAGLRDVLAHAYFGTDMTIVWNIVQSYVPQVKSQVQEILTRI